MTNHQLQLLKLLAHYVENSEIEQGRTPDDLQDSLYEVEKEERHDQPGLFQKS